MDKKRVGIILILVGVAANLLSLIFSSGYDSKGGFLGSIGTMEFILKENPYPLPMQRPEPPTYDEMMRTKELAIQNVYNRKYQDEYGIFLNEYIKYAQQSADYLEGEKQVIFFPYKYFLAFDIIVIFIGIGFVMLAGKRARES